MNQRHRKNIVICHSVRGRLRVKVSVLRCRKESAERMEEWLVRHHGIEEAQARPATGSVILFYDPTQIAPDKLFTVLSEGIEALSSSISVSKTRTQSSLSRREATSLRDSERGFKPLSLMWLIGLTVFIACNLVKKLAGATLSERPLS